MSKSINGELFNGDKYGFVGKNTSMNIVWKRSGNTYKEIYTWLCINNVITMYDYDPVERYLLDRLGKTYDDYTNEDDEIDFDSIYKDGDKFLTDEAYKEIISNENGNAYYQTWYFWNDERNEWSDYSE